MWTADARERCAPGPRGGSALRSAVFLLACLGTAACRQDMFNQPKTKPLAQSDFFDDGRSARPSVEGTVARGELRADRVFYTGIGPNGKFVGTLPVPLTKDLLLRGQERFNIFCSPCHGRVGDGRGMIVQRGFKQPPSYHIDRLRAQPIGYFFDVMTNGFGQMSSYAAQVPPADRWAIAAYIRALQLSQNAPLAQVDARDRAAIQKAGP
jgi:mono/diheme cytochrome c family protein